MTDACGPSEQMQLRCRNEENTRHVFKLRSAPGLWFTSIIVEPRHTRENSLPRHRLPQPRPGSPTQHVCTCGGQGAIWALKIILAQDLLDLTHVGHWVSLQLHTFRQLKCQMISLRMSPKVQYYLYYLIVDKGFLSSEI